MDSYTQQKLEEALIAAKEKMKEQQQLLEQLTAATNSFGHVIAVNGPRTVLATSSGFSEVATPKQKPNTGDAVLISGMTGNIVSITDFQTAGDVRSIKRVISETIAEIQMDNAEALIYLGKVKAEVGDRVMLDPTGKIALKNLGQVVEGFQFSGESKITWDDIGGLDNAKQELREAIEYPHTHAELFRRYNKDPIKGVLLYGPPGCGKTLLVKAGAHCIADMHGKESTASGFIYVKGPEILNRYVGVSEEIIRSLFLRAKKHRDKYGYPALIFIDEADAILRKRGSGRSSDMESTIVPAFLAEMDGMDMTHGVVVLATNRPDTLDNAVTRDGRIDRTVEVPRPDPAAAKTIFKIHAKKIPFSDCTPNEAAQTVVGKLFSKELTLYRVRRNDGNTMDFTLGNLINGAMVKGIVDKASSIAMIRDMQSGTRRQAGVKLADFVDSVHNSYRQNQALNHRDELAEFLEPIKDQVLGIDKLRQEV